jgi:hypothetical protein
MTDQSLAPLYEALVDFLHAKKGTLGKSVAEEAERQCIEWVPPGRSAKTEAAQYQVWLSAAEGLLKTRRVWHQWSSGLAQQVVAHVDYSDAAQADQVLRAALAGFGRVQMVEIIRPYGRRTDDATIRIFNPRQQMIELRHFAAAGVLAWGEPEGTPGVRRLARLFRSWDWPFSEEQVATWTEDHAHLWPRKRLVCDAHGCLHLPNLVDMTLLGAQDILIFRGKQYWPTPEDVIQEVHRIGLSCRIARQSIPDGMVPGVSRIALAHRLATLYQGNEVVGLKTHATLLNELKARFAALADPRVNAILCSSYEHWASRFLAMPAEVALRIFDELNLRFVPGVFGYCYWTATTYYLRRGESAVPEDLAAKGVQGIRAITLEDGEPIPEGAAGEDETTENESD